MRTAAEAGGVLRGALATESGVHIAGAWQSGERGTYDVEDPADLSVVASVADAGPRQAATAVDAAAAALDAWAGASPRTRSEVLLRSFELVRRDREDLVDLICTENGKSGRDARAEIDYAAEFFRWFSEQAVRVDGGYGSSPAGGVRTIVTRRPVGVAALVTPWNFPAAMVTRKLAPALAAGCTVVLKPAAETPLTAMALTRLLVEAGVPPGVVNLVPTTDPEAVVSAWLRDPRVRKLSFTGSTPVGRHLLRQSADRVLNTSMELGGNAPFVVLDDADVAAAVEGAVVAKFRGGGQACTAANRFYVHASVAEEFATRLGERVSALVVGRGADPTTDVGPLIDAGAVGRVRDLVDEAVARGARVVARAPLSTTLPGHFVAPVVLADVEPGARVVQEEVFAPVAPLVTWSDEAELLTMINGSELGLAAYVYSRDLQRALRMGESMEVGMVGVNRGLVSDPAAPFGGLKQSGLGREGAGVGMEEYLEMQHLSVAWPVPTR